MAEYIKREAAIESFRKNLDGGYVLTDDAQTTHILQSLPAADVRPVVRGQWKDAMQSCHDSPHVKCSVCGEYYWRYFKKFNFCPNCGADMRPQPPKEEAT